MPFHIDTILCNILCFCNPIECEKIPIEIERNKQGPHFLHGKQKKKKNGQKSQFKYWFLLIKNYIHRHQKQPNTLECQKLSNWNSLHNFTILWAMHAHIIILYWLLTLVHVCRYFGGAVRLSAKSCLFAFLSAACFVDVWIIASGTKKWQFLYCHLLLLFFLLFFFFFRQKPLRAFYFSICNNVKSWPTQHKTMDQFIMAQCVKCICDLVPFEPFNMCQFSILLQRELFFISIGELFRLCHHFS